MHCVRAGFFHGVDQRIDTKIAFACGRRTDPNGAVRRADMQRVAIRIRIHGNGFDAHPPRGAHDAARDFAAIGDQQAFEHVTS